MPDYDILVWPNDVVKAYEFTIDMRPDSPNAQWHDLAQAIFNFKEFIYIK